MKFYGLTCFYLLLCNSVIYGQTLTDVARSKEITWYGVDFSKCRFVGFKSNVMASEIHQKIISPWRDSHVSEDKAHFIKNKLGKKKIFTSLETVNTRNGSINLDSILSNKTYEIDAIVVKDIISNYNFKGNGFAVLLIMESFEAINGHACMWVAYIDRATNNLISTRRYIGEGSGFGIESYWMNAMEFAIKRCGKDLINYK